MKPSSPRFDVAVVGAGAAGLGLALALAREGIATALVGRHAPVADGRTVALLDGSVRFLRALGAWAEGGATRSTPGRTPHRRRYR